MIWSRPEVRVLFVCTANLCRSPLAEGLLRHRLQARNLAGRVQVQSAGTRVVSHGSRPDPRVELVAAEKGVSLNGIRARMLTPAMVQRSDYILVMEHRHQTVAGQMRNEAASEQNSFWRELITEPKRKSQVLLLGSFLPAPERTTDEIQDPYFGDIQGFYNVYTMIDSALNGFLLYIDT